MIIREKIEHEISFTSEEVETIRKFRDFLVGIDEHDWEILEEKFSANDYINVEPETDLTRLFNLVDDFYIFTKIN